MKYKIGKVKRPVPGAEAAVVTLTAAVNKGDVGNEITKDFEVTVLPWTAEEAATIDLSAITEATIINNNSSLTLITSELKLPVTGDMGSTIVWSSSDSITVDPSTGLVTRPPYLSGDKAVTLTATLTNGGVTRTKTFSLIVIKALITPAEKISTYLNTVLIADILNGQTYDSVISKLNFFEPSSADTSWYLELDNVWSVDKSGVIDPLTGDVTRPANGSPKETVTVTLTVNHTSTNTMASKDFVVIVLPLAD